MICIMLANITAFSQDDLIITDYNFIQLDWYDWDGSPAAINSSWGFFRYTYNPDTTGTYYINLAMTRPGGVLQWVVGNVPLFPSLIAESYTENVPINLEDLGFTPDVPAGAIDYVFTVTPDPLAVMPTAPLSSGAFISETRYAWNGPYQGEMPLIITPPVNILMTIPVTQIGASRVINEVEEDSLCCYAGAMAKSIDWLNRTHQLEIQGNAQDIYDSLRARGVSDPDIGGASVWLERKKEFCHDNALGRIITKTWDPDKESLVEWLKREIKTEDVELIYRWRDSVGAGWNGHIATVTDIYEDEDGNIYIRFMDDGHQGDDSSGNQTYVLKLIRLPDGRLGLGNENMVVAGSVSESVRTVVSGGRTGGRTVRSVVMPHQGAIRNPRTANDLHFTINSGRIIYGWSFEVPGFGSDSSEQTSIYSVSVNLDNGSIPYCTRLTIPILIFNATTGGWNGNLASDFNWTTHGSSKFLQNDTFKVCPDYGWGVNDPVSVGNNQWIFTIEFKNNDAVDDISFENIGILITDQYFDSLTEITSFPNTFDNMLLPAGESGSVDVMYMGTSSVHVYGYFDLVSTDGETLSSEWFDMPINTGVCGDATGDGNIDLLDILYLISYKYDDPPGPAPDPEFYGDANGDGNINLIDILYLIDYKYGTPPGPEPVCP